MFVVSLLSRLPLRVLYVLADFLAFMVRYVVRYRLRVVRSNINLCFPNLSESQRRAVVNGYYHHFADVIVETIWFGGGSKQRVLDQRIVEIVHPESIERLYVDGRSMVVLSSHFGNWELVGGIFDYNYADLPYWPTEQNLVCVYKKVNSKSLNDFFCRNRLALLKDPEHFEGYLETHDVLRYLVRHRKEQKFYIFITDQRPYRSAKVTLPVTFMGQSCDTMVAAANVAQQFGFSVVYQRMRRTSRGHYTYEFIPLVEDATKTTAQAIMDRYYELLTEDVVAQPEQYLWSHKRFRRRSS